MINFKKINKDILKDFFNKIKNNGSVIIAPKLYKNHIRFASVNDFNEIELDYIQTKMSAKTTVFPKCEELFNYIIEDKNIKIIENNVPNVEIVIFGLHPCDAASFQYLKKFFLNENTDKLIAQRFDRLNIISYSCKNCDEYCFCTSVGLSPYDTKGSDILFTELNNNHILAEILTEKGNLLYEGSKDLFQDSEQLDKSKYTAEVPIKFNLETIIQKAKNELSFDNQMWEKLSLACLGCGACAFSCPSCTCFDIQENSNNISGRRLRIWDTCALGLFTLHASGHNPRDIQTQRWRQRILHKFNYTVQQFGEVSCFGCGRCLRVCPANMSILEQINTLEEL